MESYFIENRDYFANRLQTLEASSKLSLPPDTPESSANAPDTTVCLRIRPLSDNEIASSHIQGVTGNSGGTAHIYEPRKKINGKPDLSTTSFTLDMIYGPEKSTQDIYDDKVEQLVKWVWDGGMSILFAYGQTGSGKTFTVSGIESLVVQRLMDGKLKGEKEVHMCIFEIFGSNVYDLLSDRKKIGVLEDMFSTTHIVGVNEKNPTTAADFLDLIDTAKSLRSTQSTAKNDHSSRSHAICRIRVVNKNSKSVSEGTFFLVDLAGSESSTDTRHHLPERMAETKEINKSLTTLKDCIRARALWSLGQENTTQKHIHIPFRASKLTQVLKSAFDVNSTQICKTLVLACVAPSILDAAQSRNTLRYAEMLRVPVPKAKPRPYDPQVPTTWNNKEVQEWIRQNSGSPTVNPQLIATYENGMQLCKIQQDDFIARALRTPGVRPGQAKALYFRLWALHIDSRALSMKGTANGTTTAATSVPTNETQNHAPPKRISHGAFFQLDSREVEAEIVMVMGPENGGGEAGHTYVCAAMCSTNKLNGEYELFVARQQVIKDEKLRNEVVMDYDSQTRYYRLRDNGS